MKWDSKIINIILAILFLALVVMFFFLNKSAGECLNDPLKYISHEIPEDVTFTCTASNPAYKSFYLGKDKVYIERMDLRNFSFNISP